MSAKTGLGVEDAFLQMAYLAINNEKRQETLQQMQEINEGTFVSNAETDKGSFV